MPSKKKSNLIVTSLLRFPTLSLILQHLTNSGYDYSTSIFREESQLDKEAPINAADFFQIQDKTHLDLLSGDNIKLPEIIKHLLNSKSTLLSNLSNNFTESAAQTTNELLNFSETMNLLNSRKQMKIEAIDNSALQELESSIERRLQSKFDRESTVRVYICGKKFVC